MKKKKEKPKYSPFVRSIVIETIRNETRANLPTEADIELLLKKNEEGEEGEEEVAVAVAVAVAVEEEETPADDEEYDDDYYDDDADETAVDDYGYAYDNTGAFIIRSGTDWQLQDDDEPEAGMLLGKLWMQNELCILFADTNVGKSILAVQIADSVSRGVAVPGFELTLPAAPVLYFDFELSDQQFRRRYSSVADGKHPFTRNFFRATLNPFTSKHNKFNTYEEFINNEIENALLACKAKVLIIDNITCLRYGTQSAAGALNLMEYLQNIKRRYQISILVLAHTPKRNTTKPLSRNDLQGSKMLINLADSAFAIGESQQTAGVRYLKQIKQRSTSEEYGAANICCGAIVKTRAFLHFQFTGQGYESDHLATHNEQYRKNTETRIAQLNKQGLSIRQVAARLGLASTTVFRTLKRLGQCEGGCADSGCADVRMEEYANVGGCEEGCADFECADVRMEDSKSKNAPFVILNESEGSSPCAPADKSAAQIPLIDPAPQIDERAPDALVNKSAPGVILKPSKDERKGPEDVHVQANQQALHALPTDKHEVTPLTQSEQTVIPQPSRPASVAEMVRKTLEHPLMPRVPDHVRRSKGYQDLVKQYHMELAMLRGESP